MAYSKKKAESKSIVGQEVTLEEFKEYISFDFFKKSYKLLGVISQAKVDDFIKNLSK